MSLDFCIKSRIFFMRQMSAEFKTASPLSPPVSKNNSPALGGCNRLHNAAGIFGGISPAVCQANIHLFSVNKNFRLGNAPPIFKIGENSHETRRGSGSRRRNGRPENIARKRPPLRKIAVLRRHIQRRLQQLAPVARQNADNVRAVPPDICSVKMRRPRPLQNNPPQHRHRQAKKNGRLDNPALFSNRKHCCDKNQPV